MIPIRIPLAFQCDDEGCRKPLNELAVISPRDGRVFCNNICASRDHMRVRFVADPPLVPNYIKARPPRRRR